MELKQEQQQLISMEMVENVTFRTILTKLINVVLAILAVILVFVSTTANLISPFLTSRYCVKILAYHHFSADESFVTEMGKIIYATMQRGGKSIIYDRFSYKLDRAAIKIIDWRYTNTKSKWKLFLPSLRYEYGATDKPQTQSQIFLYYMSHVMRKPAFCICENKDADQLRGNREADQHLCFHYTDSIIPLLSKYKISSL